MKYILSYSNPCSQYVDIEFVISNINSEVVEVQLPAWRPGRYELGNFAKNIQKWAAYDQKGNQLKHRKIKKDLWEIKTNGATSIHILYNYYAAELNAGSTWLDEKQLYVNPVNCFLYVPQRINEACVLELQIPINYTVASGMNHLPAGDDANEIINNEFKIERYRCSNFHELADSPFIASAGLEKRIYDCQGIKFHVWFQGLMNPSWDKVINDFEKFTQEQFKIFGSFPFTEYHFLFQILPHKAYHGVEHQNNTVITLGPTHSVMDGELYQELLGVSCHELFHAWNIKAIRPAEMYPYDYTGENYSRLGYVAEGVTTYYGDLMLYRSGVFNDKPYFETFNEQLQKHFDNFGRFNLSVADSSFDTWLDGYTPGIPNRKVSIYTEGCLLAFITDVLIRRETKNQKSLDDVMRVLYTDYAKQNKGYSEIDYRNTVELIADKSFKDFFESCFYGTQSLEPLLNECLEYLGLEMNKKAAPKYYEAYLGFKILEDNGKKTVKNIHPDSPASLAGLMLNDQIIAVNGIKVNHDLHEWCNYFSKNNNEPIVLTVASSNKMKYISIPFSEKVFYRIYEISKREVLNDEQKTAFERWAC